MSCFRVSQHGDKTLLVVRGLIEDREDADAAIEQLRGARTVEIFVDCDGGDVASAFKVFDSLRSRTPVCTITGICGSSATIIALAADRIRVVPGSRFLLHAPTVMLGVATMAQLQDSLSQLEKQVNRWAILLQKKMGAAPETIRRWLSDGEDYWFDSGEALRIGLADELLAEQETASEPETDPGALGSVASPPAPSTPDDAELLLNILQGVGEIKTRDVRKLFRELSFWFRENIREHP